MQKRLMNNKGISPLIATVILIGATVALFAIVYTLMRGVTLGQVEKVDCSSQEQITVDFVPVCKTADNSFEVEITNSGRTRIDGIMAVVHCNNGAPVGFPATVNSCKPGEVCKVAYTIPGECTTGVDRVEVIPGVVKESSGKVKKFVACIDKSQEALCSA